MAKHYAQLLLLFILLISALGCYCAFSKQVPADEEEGLSKLKMMRRNLKGNELSTTNYVDSDYQETDMKPIFDDIRKYSTRYADLVKQMCEDTDCVDDPACAEAGKELGSTEANLICGSCDGKKCTYVQAAPEVVTEPESEQDDIEETTQVTNE